MALLGSREVILRMSVLSAPILHMEGPVSAQASPIVQEKETSANEMSGYRTCMSIEDAIQKCIPPISVNARNRI